MIQPYTRNLHQDAMYWPPVGNDGFGGMTYGTPVLIKCRWQDRMTLVRDAEGKEVTSSAIVYADQALEVEGLLLLGATEWNEASPPSNARQIIAFGASPSLRATLELNKAWML